MNASYLLIVLLFFILHVFYCHFQITEKFFLSCQNTTKQTTNIPNLGEIRVIETKCPNQKQSIVTSELQLISSQLLFGANDITKTFSNNSASVYFAVPAKLVISDKEVYAVGNNVKPPIIPSTFNQQTNSYQISWNHNTIQLKSPCKFQIMLQDNLRTIFVCNLNFIDTVNYNLFTILPQNNQFI
jgi:hypothetical protein